MGVDHVSKIEPCLWFDDRAEEAANFYVSVFSARRATMPDGGESKILGVSRYGEAGPGPAGSVMTVEFLLEGQEFLALNGGPRVHVHSGDLAHRELRDTGGSGPAVGDALRGWTQGRVRLAGRPVRRVLADRAHGADRTARRPQPRTVTAGDEGDAGDGQARHRTAASSGRGRVGGSGSRHRRGAITGGRADTDLDIAPVTELRHGRAPRRSRAHPKDAARTKTHTIRW